MKPNYASSESCSCTSCTFKSEPECLSKQKIIVEGSQLHLEKSIPLREKRYVKKHKKARGIHEQINNERISKKELSFYRTTDIRLKNHLVRQLDDVERSSTISELVHLVDKRVALRLKRLNECYSYSCSTFQNDYNMNKRNRYYNHIAKYNWPAGSRYTISTSSMADSNNKQHYKRSKRFVTSFRTKHIRSAPCTCTSKNSCCSKQESNSHINKYCNHSRLAPGQILKLKQSKHNIRNSKAVKRVKSKIKSDALKFTAKYSLNMKPFVADNAIDKGDYTNRAALPVLNQGFKHVQTNYNELKYHERPNLFSLLENRSSAIIMSMHSLTKKSISDMHIYDNTTEHCSNNMKDKQNQGQNIEDKEMGRILSKGIIYSNVNKGFTKQNVKTITSFPFISSRTSLRTTSIGTMNKVEFGVKTGLIRRHRKKICRSRGVEKEIYSNRYPHTVPYVIGTYALKRCLCNLKLKYNQKSRSSSNSTAVFEDLQRIITYSTTSIQSNLALKPNNLLPHERDVFTGMPVKYKSNKCDKGICNCSLSRESYLIKPITCSAMFSKSSSTVRPSRTGKQKSKIIIPGSSVNQILHKKRTECLKSWFNNDIEIPHGISFSRNFAVNKDDSHRANNLSIIKNQHHDTPTWSHNDLFYKSKCLSSDLRSCTLEVTKNTKTKTKTQVLLKGSHILSTSTLFSEIPISNRKSKINTNQQRQLNLLSTYKNPESILMNTPNLTLKTQKQQANTLTKKCRNAEKTPLCYEVKEKHRSLSPKKRRNIQHASSVSPNDNYPEFTNIKYVTKNVPKMINGNQNSKKIDGKELIDEVGSPHSYLKKEKEECSVTEKKQENTFTDILRRCFLSFKLSNFGKIKTKKTEMENFTDIPEFDKTVSNIRQDTQKNSSKTTGLRLMLRKYIRALQLRKNDKNLKNTPSILKQAKETVYTVSRVEIAETNNKRSQFCPSKRESITIQNKGVLLNNEQRISKFLIPRLNLIKPKLNSENSLLKVARSISDFSNKRNSYKNYRLSRHVTEKKYIDKTFFDKPPNEKPKAQNVGSCLIADVKYITEINDRNPFSKQQFLTMNMQNKQRLLDPNECESGVCEPYKCDPNKCRKLIIKRQTKTKMSAMNVATKSSSSYTPRKVKAKKYQQSVMTLEHPVKSKPVKQGVVYKKGPNKSRRQAVRVGSSFSFNIEFSKNQSAAPHNATVSELKQSRIRTRSDTTSVGKKKSHGTTRNKVKRHNKDSQSSVTVATKASTVAPKLKRCFCTLKLQKKGKEQHKIFYANQSTSTPPGNKRGLIGVQSVGSTTTKTKQKVVPHAVTTSTKSKASRELAPHECEPHVCIPGQCDPYECLKRINKRNKRTRNRGFSAGPPAQSTSIATSPKIHKKVTKMQQIKKKSPKSAITLIQKPSAVVSSNSQAVRIGSTFSFSVEFYKDKTPTENEIQNAAAEIKKKKKIRAVTTESNMTTTTSRASGIGKKMRDKDAKAKILKTQTQGTATLRRCFCTLQLHKQGRVPADQVTIIKSRGTKGKLVKKKPDMYTKTVVANRKLLPYECDPGVCVPGECDPSECFKRIQNRLRKERGTTAKNHSSKSVSSLTTVHKDAHHGTQFKKTMPSMRVVKQIEQKKRQAVRIGSNFSFNIEFFKDRTIPIQPAQHQPSYLSPVTKPSRTGRKNGLQPSRTRESTFTKPSRKGVSAGDDISREGTRTHAIKKKTGQSQDQRRTRNTESQMTHPKKVGGSTVTNLKRCFCTLSLSKPTAGTKSMFKANKNKIVYDLIPVDTKLNYKKTYQGSISGTNKCLEYYKRKSLKLESSSFKDTTGENNNYGLLLPLDTSFSHNTIDQNNKEKAFKQFNNECIVTQNANYFDKMIETKNPLYKHLKSNSVAQNIYLTESQYANKVSYSKGKWSSSTGIAPYFRSFFYALRLSTSTNKDVKVLNQPKAPITQSKAVYVKQHKQSKQSKPDPVVPNKKRRTPLLPNECEPGICIPGKCDPYECFKRMHKKIKQSEKGIGPDKQRKKSISSFTSTHKRKAHERTQSICPRYRNGVCSIDNNYLVEEPRFKSIDNPFRQAVRISSSFTFNIEFYKDRMPPIIEMQAPFTNEMPKRERKHSYAQSPKTRDKNMCSTGICLQNRKLQTKGTYSPSRDVGTGVQRCFCTKAIANLHEKSTRANFHIPAAYADKGTGKKNYKLLPYECQPNVCIPGQCDPYECLKRMQKRSLKDASNFSKYDDSRKHKTGQIGTQRDHKMVQKPFPTPSRQHRASYPTDNRNRQTVRIGSKFSFDVEFFKDHTNGQTIVRRSEKKSVMPSSNTVPCNKNICTRQKRSIDQGIFTPHIRHHKKAQVPNVKTESRASGVVPLLKRCFCTLKIQKSPKIVNYLSVDVQFPFGTKNEKQLRTTKLQPSLEYSNLKHMCHQYSRVNSNVITGKKTAPSTDKIFHSNTNTIKRGIAKKNKKNFNFNYFRPSLNNTYNKLDKKHKGLTRKFSLEPEMKTLYPYSPKKFNKSITKSIVYKRKNQANIVKSRITKRCLNTKDNKINIKDFQVGNNKSTPGRHKSHKSYPCETNFKKLLKQITTFFKSKQNNSVFNSDKMCTKKTKYKDKPGNCKKHHLKDSKSRGINLDTKIKADDKQVKVIKIFEKDKGYNKRAYLNLKRRKYKRNHAVDKEENQVKKGKLSVIPYQHDNIFCSYCHTFFRNENFNLKRNAISPFASRKPVLLYPVMPCKCKGTKQYICPCKKPEQPHKTHVKKLSKKENDLCDKKPLFEMQLQSSDMAIVNREEVIKYITKLNMKRKQEAEISQNILRQLHGKSCKCCICQSLNQKQGLAKEQLTVGKTKMLHMKTGGLFHKGPKPCICGSKPCADASEKLNTKKEKQRRFQLKPCVCGTEICEKERLKHALKKKGLSKKDKQKMKVMEKHKKQKKKKSKRKKAVKKTKKKVNRDSFIKRQKIYRDQIKRELKEQLRADKIAHKMLKKNKHTNDIMLVCDALIDVTKLGFSTLGRMTRCIFRSIIYPKHTCKSLLRNLQEPESLVGNTRDACVRTGALGTAKRIRYRFGSMKTVGCAGSWLAKTSLGRYLLTALEPDQKKRLKLMKSHRRPVRKERMPMNFECSLYMASLRRKPYWKLFFTCPWFYPHWISMVKLWRHFVEVILFICAVLVWSPCILCMEVCRATMCCTLCTG